LEDPRVAPHSVEAEQGVLGCVLLENSRLAEVGGLVTAADFHLPLHRAIYTSVQQLVAAQRLADPITVHDASECPLPYMMELVSSVTRPQRARDYALIVAERSRRRQLVEQAEILRERALADVGGVDGLDALCSEAIGALLRLQGGGNRWEPRLIGELLPGWMDHLDARAEGRIKPIPTGLEGVDKALCGGMERGDLVVIGARPSMGKSALSLTVGQRTTATGHVVLICSQEDSAQMLVSRNVASAGRINLAHLRQPERATDGDWGRVSEAVDKLAGRQIWIDDQPGIGLADVRRKAHQVKARSPGGRLDVIVVDYLQLMEGDGDNRHLVLGAIAAGLKKLAKELQCAVMLLSQLSRKADETKAPPRMDHLRESGGIEEAADVVALLYRPGRVDKKTPETEAQLEIVKNKNGSTRTVKLYFDGAHQRFEDVADEEVYGG